MTAVNDEDMTVLRSIRQAFESYGAAGSAVHQDPNPYFINVTGAFDLLKASRLVIANLDALRTAKVVEAEKLLAQQIKEKVNDLI